MTGWIVFCVGLATAACAGIMLVKSARDFAHNVRAGGSAVPELVADLVLVACCGAIAWIGLLIISTP